MAKAHEIGTSSIKKVYFACHINTVFLIIFFKNNVGGKVSCRRIRVVLHMWGENVIDILAHKVGKKTKYIGHFGYVQFANYGNQCLTIDS